jgi:hypothetical protein
VGVQVVAASLGLQLGLLELALSSRAEAAAATRRSWLEGLAGASAAARTCRASAMLCEGVEPWPMEIDTSPPTA